MNQPAVQPNAAGVSITGDWRAAALRADLHNLRQALLDARGETHWDLSGVTDLDTVGAAVIVGAWSGSTPPSLSADDACRSLLTAVARQSALEQPPAAAPGAAGLRSAGAALRLAGQLLAAMLAALRHPPWLDVSRHVHSAAVRALPIIALVSLLVGLSIGYLFSQLLIRYGGSAYIVNVVGLSTIRDIAPMLAALLIAGRSASAMTAELALQRITQELDALTTYGVRLDVRLMLPKILSLTLAMPALTLWSAAFVLTGSIGIAVLQLPIGVFQFVEALPVAVPPVNLLIALVKSMTFGTAIGFIACYHGISSEPTTESLARRTTAAVVTSIGAVILLNAYADIVVRNVGLQ